MTDNRSRGRKILFIVFILGKWLEFTLPLSAHIFFRWLAVCLNMPQQKFGVHSKFLNYKFFKRVFATNFVASFFFPQKLNNIFVNEMWKIWPPFALMTLWRRFEHDKKKKTKKYCMENMNMADGGNK